MVVADWVVALRRGQKVARDELGALVNQLIEGMLAVGAGLPPNHGAGLIIHPQPIFGNALAIAFHIALLEIVSKTLHGLVVGKNGVRLCVKEIVVPNAQERHDDRDILGKRSGAKIVINGVRPAQQGLKIVHADVDGDGKTDG